MSADDANILKMLTEEMIAHNLLKEKYAILSEKFDKTAHLLPVVGRTQAE
jgi:plasmid replication initiation protein